VFRGRGRYIWESLSLNFLKSVSENFWELCEIRDGFIPYLREWNLRMRIFNALDISLAAMINLSVEESCGIGKLWETNSSVSTMR
jgi:hypothetical protein